MSTTGSSPRRPSRVRFRVRDRVRPLPVLLQIAALILSLPVLATGCKKENSRLAPDAAPVEFVGESFAELYPIFMVRRSMPIGEKAHLWSTKYLGRYVRWAGTIRSFTPNGVTLKELPQTITFDVSLWMENDQLAELKRHYKKGDRLGYVGRLESYDDIFRTMYLGHGLIVDSPPDGGPPSESAPDR